MITFPTICFFLTDVILLSDQRSDEYLFQKRMFQHYIYGLMTPGRDFQLVKMYEASKKLTDLAVNIIFIRPVSFSTGTRIIPKMNREIQDHSICQIFQKQSTILLCMLL